MKTAKPRKEMDRRRFLAGQTGLLGGAATLIGHSGSRSNGTPALAQRTYLPMVSRQGYRVYIARNGTPVTNVQRVIALAGGIERFIDFDDAVVLKPNGQWPNQGYTHTLCMKALIDIILDRPGGFGGEIIIAEHVHRDPVAALTTSYCWNMSPANRQRNWADMNYLELVEDYHRRGIPNVSAIPLYDSGQGGFLAVPGPQALKAGQHGWVRTSYTNTANAKTVRLSHAVLYSPYSHRWIDFSRGVWENGGYNGQNVKILLLPTLNNHGSQDSEDYAGPTSAVKCHLGIVEFTGFNQAPYTLHSVGYDNPIKPEAMGESVGYLITQVIRPTFYMTCAEYTGYGGRTGSAATQTKVVGLCEDPVTLDYWMCKYIMLPCRTRQTFMNPDLDNNLRKQLLGCNRMGVGTIKESEMDVLQVNLS